MNDKLLFENTLLKSLLNNYLSNDGRRGKYKKIFIFIFFLVFSFLLFYFFSYIFSKNVNHVAIVEISGVISEKSNCNYKSVIINLDRAFKNKYAKAVILKVNSPGGAPVQANIIYNYIKKLKSSNVKPVYAVIDDIGTSAAYYIALSADKIYCDPSSLVGSIGVVFSSFGFVDAINKIGVERRIYKSGKYKVILDPFLSIKKDEELILDNAINIIYKNFVNIVKENRGQILVNSDSIFSGEFFVGVDALNLGLVDGFYNLYSLLSDVIKINKIIYYNSNFDILNLFNNAN